MYMYIIRPILWPAVCSQLCLMVRYGTGKIREPANGQLCDTVRDRYGIAPGVTQTNKQTNKHQIKAVWTLASARRY